MEYQNQRQDGNSSGRCLSRRAVRLLAAFVLLTGWAASQSSGQPQATTEFDSTDQVAPGLTHRSRRFLRDGSPFVVHILEVNPRHPAINLLPVRALDRAAGKETVSSMAKRYGAVAAINGGYFQVSGPYAGTSNGVYQFDQAVVTSGRNRSALLLCEESDYREHAEIDVVNFAGSVTAGRASFPISAMNRPRRPNELAIYSHLLGPTTMTDAAGVEVAMSHDGRVERINRNTGNTAIPFEGYVLSATGQAANWLEKHTMVGASLKLNTRLAPAISVKEHCRAFDIMGAGPRLVQNGTVTVSDEGFAHAAARHPRSAFAITRRGTLLLLTLDGRQPSSAGMTLEELAAELVALGAAEAINLDGGGSTTMFVNGSVRNSPSDGDERPVANALLVFSVPDLKALTALVEQLAPAQIHPALLIRIRETLRSASKDPTQVRSLVQIIRSADHSHITPAAARLLMEASASLSNSNPPDGYRQLSRSVED